MTPHRPQRIVHDSKPGSLLKRATVPTASARTSDPGDADSYLALVRLLPCLCCGMEPSEAAHVRFASAAFGKASGMQKKPDDKWALPLCADDHRLAKTAQHNRREQEFWNSLGINPLICAEQLYAAREDPVAMRMIAVLAIATRRKK